MRSVYFITLGCKVNQYDTEAMAACFEAAEYAVAPDAASADVIVVNTCTVTGTGDKKSRQTVAQAHRSNANADIVVTGCYTQRDAQAVMDMPGVVLVMGTQDRARVVDLLREAQKTGKPVCAVQALPKGRVFEEQAVGAPMQRTRATLKIQDGCNRHCTYCIIPSVRGEVASRPLKDIRAQADSLAQNGVLEIVVTGINLACYGQDLHAQRLSDAIQAVAQAGIPRIRLGSLDISAITPEFIGRARQISGLCPQFHLSLQSGSATVLTRMGRRYTPQAYQEAVKALRTAFENCAITTDIIAGFPGETEVEHQETCDFIQKIGFARAHIFPYSAREGTAAARMAGQLPKRLRFDRARELTQLAKQSGQRYTRAQQGLIRPVLWEKAESRGVLSGYTPEYVRVYLAKGPEECGMISDVRLGAPYRDGVRAEALMNLMEGSV